MLEPVTQTPLAAAPPPSIDPTLNQTPLASSSPPQPPAQQVRSVSSLVGKWTVTDANTSCQIQLSSSATLDLYKASTGNCGIQALRDVNTWSLRNQEIALYAKGRIVGRLQESGSEYIGQVEGQKRPIVMAR
ncbi:AprI/Inh family metalloprotease inhibitor [Microvirga rosea]|uniref:AprI/Inh family metalloprotease inhibitor n=1 Tax=Microvirga rosea TaxID=2715425 RepID=UPI001D09A584|nr:AprI/Inh family metalloprotease inhibitor [Microvirga rosea]